MMATDMLAMPMACHAVWRLDDGAGRGAAAASPAPSLASRLITPRHCTNRVFEAFTLIAHAASGLGFAVLMRRAAPAIRHSRLCHAAH